MNDHINSNEFRHNPLSLSFTYLVKAKTLQGIEKTEKIILK